MASLDILRGLTLFLLVFFQPVLWALLSPIDTDWSRAVLHHFDHEVWEGFRIWDLVMPLFLFMVTIRNQPSCSNSSRFRTLQAKKAMFNLNENNRIVMSQHPSDMRIGVNGMCGQVRKVGLDPSNGDVYIFVGRSRQLMKILHWERGGYVMYYKRLEQGRFHPRIFLREGIGFRTMRWDELVLLMEGISPKVARRKRFPNPNGKLELSRKK